MIRTHTRKRVWGGLCAAVVLLLAGCENSRMEQGLWEQINKLGKQRDDLEARVAALEKENEDLRGRVEALSQVAPGKRVEALAGLKDVQIGQRTGLFDKNSDGTAESLIVYVKPTDTAGDVVKVPGAVHVQLWDLNADRNQALLAEWTVDPVELKKLWAGTFMTYYYRLTFDVADLAGNRSQELTVKVAFTDYITGRVIRKQMPIQPNP